MKGNGSQREKLERKAKKEQMWNMFHIVATVKKANLCVSIHGTSIGKMVISMKIGKDATMVAVPIAHMSQNAYLGHLLQVNTSFPFPLLLLLLPMMIMILLNHHHKRRHRRRKKRKRKRNKKEKRSWR